MSKTAYDFYHALTVSKVAARLVEASRCQTCFREHHPLWDCSVLKNPKGLTLNEWKERAGVTYNDTRKPYFSKYVEAWRAGDDPEKYRGKMAAMDEVATEFPSEDALKRYLEKHPKADKSKHKVVTPDDRAKAKQDKKDQDARDYQKGLDTSISDLAKQNGLSRNEMAYEFAKSVGLDPREHMDKKDVEKVERDKKDPDHQLKQKTQKLHSDIDQLAKETGKTRKQIIEDAVSRGLGMKSAQHRGFDPMSSAREFRHALTASKVASRFVEAMDQTSMEFATPDALQKYLKDHPNADKSKHTVKKPGEDSASPSSPAAPKGADLDGVPGLDGHPALDKIKAGKASKDELKSAIDSIQDKFDNDESLYNAEDDDPKLKKTQAAMAHLNAKFNDAVQKSPEYATTTTEGYYPQKAPKGMELPPEIHSLPEKVTEYALSMPDEDLDKDEAYNHPKVKAVANKLKKSLKSGELSKEQFHTDMQDLDKLLDTLTHARMDAKSDKEGDPYRFAARKVYQTIRAYRSVVQGI